jgi:type IV secretory pathway TraG/TraD family ATPase VirD4
MHDISTLRLLEYMAAGGWLWDAEAQVFRKKGAIYRGKRWVTREQAEHALADALARTEAESA